MISIDNNDLTMVSRVCISYSTPIGGILLVYRPETRGHVAPEGGGSINRQHTSYRGAIIDL